MSHLESLISRYLDGELATPELDELLRLLDRSADARARFDAMAALVRAARSTPAEDRPTPAMDSRLFDRLRLEGYRSPRIAGTGRIESRGPVASPLVRRSFTTVLLLLLSLAIGDRFHDATVATMPHAVASLDPPSIPPISAPLPSPHASSDSPVRLNSIRSNPGLRNTGRVNSNGLNSNRLNSNRSRSDDGAALPARLATAEEPNATDSHEYSATAPDAPSRRPDGGAKHLNGRRSASDESIDRSDADALAANSAIASTAHGIVIGLRPSAGIALLNEGNTANEFAVRIDVEVAEHHRFFAFAGSSPVITQFSPGPSMSSAAVQSGSSNAQPRQNLPSGAGESLAIASEAWAGVGYEYTYARTGPLEFALGGSAGAGSRTWRAGIEAPVSFRITPSVSVECVPSITRVIPHDQSRVLRTRQGDYRTMYLEWAEHPAFTTAGVQLGVSVSFGENR